MGYDAANDSYVDSESHILINKLGISSEDKLTEAEAEITAVESSAIIFESDLAKLHFDQKLLHDIHYQLFHRIYEWAGEFRTIDLQKGRTYFAHAPHIQPQLTDLINELATEEYLQSLEREKFVVRFAHYYSELNVIHPFREGNGRTIRLFLSLLAY